MNLCPRIGNLISSSTFLRPSVTRSLDIFSCQVMVGRLFPMNFGGRSQGYCTGGRPFILVWLPFMSLLLSILVVLIVLLTLCNFSCPIAKEHPELKSRFKDRVQEAIKYISMIDDFDELVDPCTLACHYLGLEPSLYILQTIDREERKSELPWCVWLSFSFSSF